MTLIYKQRDFRRAWPQAGNSVDYILVYINYKEGIQRKLPLERSLDLMFPGDSLQAEQDSQQYSRRRTRISNHVWIIDHDRIPRKHRKSLRRRKIMSRDHAPLQSERY